MRVLLPLPVVLPLVAAGLSIALGRRPLLQRLLSLLTLLVTTGTACVLLATADRDGAQVVQAGGWAAPAGISLVADRLSTLLLVVSQLVLLAVLVYAVGQGVADGDREPRASFHPCYLVLAAGIALAFLTGDLFNLFVAFEVMLVASYVLLTLGGGAEQVRAGMTYVVVSLLASVLFVTVVGLVYAATGTVNLADLAVRMQDVPDGVRVVLGLTMLVVFGIKAAIFPLFSWLPDSYPTAPSPVTAVFAGLLTKVGVYAIIRTQTLLFPGGALDSVLMWAALATMVIGILGAVAQTDIRRILSFTLVSHIGYMVFGIALGTAAGLAGAIFYVVHHIAIQTTLFLVTGLIETRGGSTSLNRLGGLAAASPVLGILFFVPAMNLAGIPPLSGFVGKVGLLEAGAQQGGFLAYLLVGGSVLTSLLTLYAMAKVWNRAFWRPRTAEPDVLELVAGEEDSGPVVAPGTTKQVAAAQDRAQRTRLPRPMVATATVLVLLGVGITVVAGPLYGYAERSAADIVEGVAYVRAVLPEGVR